MSLFMSDGNPEPEKWAEMFNEFEKNFKEAYFSINKALKLNEEGKLTEALPVYEFGLSLIDKALELTLNEPLKPDLSWEKALVKIQELKKTRKEIILRIENIKSKPEEKQVDSPPSYNEVISNSKSDSYGTTNTNGNTFQLPGPSKAEILYLPPSAIQDEELLANLHFDEQGNSDASVTYFDLSQQLNEMKLAKNKEILFHCDNVQLHFIAPDGRVSSTYEPNILIIARVLDKTCSILDEALLNIVSDLSKEISETKKKKHKHHSLHRKRHHHKEKKHSHRKKDEGLDMSKRTFLQVGSWVYPLIPNVSPCFRTENGTLIFPDVNAEIEGATVGIILPEDKIELFIHLLNEMSATRRSRRSVSTDYSSNNFSSKFLYGATYLAQNLVSGAESTAKFLDYSTPKIIDRINPNPEPRVIEPKIQRAFEVAKTISEKSYDVTDYLATKICMATSALGRYLSPHVQKHGTNILTSTTNMSEAIASQKINSLLNVTSDAVEGLSTIYSGLEIAGRILARSLANNTVQIIKYKYGQPAGALTSDALATLGNVYYTHHNFRHLKPKGIAKATVRGAGKAILEDYRISAMNSKPHEEFQGSGPGSGAGFFTV